MKDIWVDEKTDEGVFTYKLSSRRTKTISFAPPSYKKFQ